MVRLPPPATGGGVKFKWPQEAVGLLEEAPAGQDLVNEIFHSYDTVFAKLFFYNIIINRDTLSVDGRESSFVYEIPYGLEVGVSPCHVWLNHSQQGFGALVDLDEYSVVDLSETEQLHNFLDLGGHAVNTLNSHYKGNLGLSWNTDALLGLGQPVEANFLLTLSAIINRILLSTAESLSGTCSPQGSPSLSEA